MAESIKMHIRKDVVKFLLEEKYKDTRDIHELIKKEWSLDDDGAKVPTLCQLEEVCKKLKKPLAFFFLEPKADMELVQFDTRVIGSEKLIVGYKVGVKIEELQHIRERHIELCNQLNIDFMPKFEAFNLENPKDVASFITSKIIQEKPTSKHSDYLNVCIKQIEEMGILVFRVDKRLDEKLRGFAIYNEILPIIGITTEGEAVVGQIFSLFHELAHILTRSTMLHNKDVANKFEHSEVERFCNKVASMVLLPEEYFQEKDNLAKLQKKETISLDDIEVVAMSYHVSRDTMIYRLKEMGFLDKGGANRLMNELEKKRAAEPKKKHKGIKNGHIHKSINELGKKFCETVKIGYSKGLVSEYGLCDYLGQTREKCLEILSNVKS